MLDQDIVITIILKNYPLIHDFSIDYKNLIYSKYFQLIQYSIFKPF